MATAVIEIDGVLRKLIGGQLIPEGVRLYHALCSAGGVILLCDQYENMDNMNDWLTLENFIRHDDVQSYVGIVSKLNTLRGQQRHHVDLVVVADPDDANRLIRAGFNTLLFTHAEYAHPSWRPDTATGVLPWESLSKQVADNARMKAMDKRLQEKDIR